MAVVRCPACRGESRVPTDAIGQMVGCPLCQTPFVAAEDATETPLPSRTGNPPARTRPTRGAAPRPAAVIPIAPPRQPRTKPPQEPTEPQPGSGPVLATEVPDPEHDPHSPPVGGLPVSVLVGFALMPFGIPLLWYVGPLVSGKEASLSLAVPVSLAVAAAALCLGIVYTIDWTAATRIKGVLMLVGLAYLSAAGLYFLKKDLMDRFQGFFNRSNDWRVVQARDRSCQAEMPGRAWSDRDKPPLSGLVPLSDNWKAMHFVETQPEQAHEYQFAVSKPDAGPPGSGWFAQIREQVWFARVGEELKSKGGKVVGEAKPVRGGASPEPNGRQWIFECERTVRIVRVFLIKNRVYYLSAEGPGLEPDNEYAKPFFDSFEILPPKKK